MQRSDGACCRQKKAPWGKGLTENYLSSLRGRNPVKGFIRIHAFGVPALRDLDK
jgi:hypothetical protein